jgi:predicted DsbA family dithiol-disulfide isomerase
MNLASKSTTLLQSLAAAAERVSISFFVYFSSISLFSLLLEGSMVIFIYNNDTTNKMDTKTRKTLYFCLGVIAVLLIYFLFFAKPSYDDVLNPKPIKGNEEATVKIVEFSDLQCPACGAAHPITKQILNEFGDQVSLEYKHFPLTSIHFFAFDAAAASECANDQGKFWEYVDIAFVNQDALQKNNLAKYAEQLNLNMDSFNACFKSEAKEKYVRADINEGLGKDLQGTPSFFINGEKLDSWEFENFKEAVEAALAE